MMATNGLMNMDIGLEYSNDYLFIHSLCQLECLCIASLCSVKLYIIYISADDCF